MKKLKTTLFQLLIICCASLLYQTGANAQSNESSITGIWFNEEKTAKIKVYKEGDKFYGDIIWVDFEPGDSKLDDNNPDPEKRDQPLVGLTILKGFEYEGDSEYEDGTIYDPENGKTYDCIMELETNDKLNVRGYIGFSLIGRTTHWTRAN